MRAISVTVESYHDDLWLDGWCDSGSGLLSVRVLILILMLLLFAGLVIPCTLNLLSPPQLFIVWEGRGIISHGVVRVNVPPRYVVRIDALLSL